MKKLAKILSTILIITIFIGVGWYFAPIDQMKAGAKSIGEGVFKIWDKLGEDNITFDAIKLDKNTTTDEGDLGTELDFSTTNCPYRTFLSVKEQGVYNQIYANARDLNTTFKLACILTADELNETYVAVICDHPELFWVDNKYQYGYTGGDKDSATQMTLEYNDLKNSLGSAKTGFDSATTAICSAASKLSTPAEKEKYVFDTLAKLISYKSGAAYNQTAYSGLVQHSTVCAGYARAFQHILNKLGIPCYYVYGTANSEYHAWNMVELDGQWYNVDLTWCDQDSGVAYTYYNVTDASLSKNHTRSDRSAKLPSATGTKYAYSPEKAAEIDNGNGSSAPASNGSSGTAAKPSIAGMLYTINDYNAACYEKLVANGTGSYSFTLTLCDTQLYDEITAASRRGDYQAGYLDGAMAKLGISKCSYDYSISGNSDDNTGVVTMVQKVTFKSK